MIISLNIFDRRVFVMELYSAHPEARIKFLYK